MKEEKSPYPYLMEVNPLRQEIGLRVIDSTFIYYGYNSKSTFIKRKKIYGNFYVGLKNEYRKTKKEPSFFEKYIKLDKNTGKPQYEEDRYKNGSYKYGFNEGGDILESLSFRYVFEDYKYYDFETKDSIPISKGWKYIYEYPIVIKGMTSNRPEKDKNGYWERKTEQLSKKQADSILKSWNLKRLNY
ncbi:MAG: hypothetical protein AB8B65_09285 [Kordia sp.]|uniref:hypothetical protein n=1 Tax=Kordia sp. TaxID=1965332 RepID=UPI0038596474